MNHNTAPAALVEALASIGLDDLLVGFVARKRVGVRFIEIERFAAKFGYTFDREHGNVYGRLMLKPITTTHPAFRIITRSDHAASNGSKRRAA